MTKYQEYQKLKEQLNSMSYEQKVKLLSLTFIHEDVNHAGMILSQQPFCEAYDTLVDFSGSCIQEALEGGGSDHDADAHAFEQAVELFFPNTEQKQQIEWHLTTEKLPEIQEGLGYTQVPCLVEKRYNTEYNGNNIPSHQIQILVFNHQHECWDDEHGYNHDCPINQVRRWAYLPYPPKFNQWQITKK